MSATLHIAAIGALLLTANAIYAADTTWRFAVSLDNKPVGFHTFALTDVGNQRGPLRTLRSEARFDVKLLFINAYHYAHQSDEVWQGDCLQRIESHTDDNGKRISVSGAQQNDSLLVTSGQRTSSLGTCVLTFAYWNPAILSASQLLNPQSGEYVPIKVTRIGSEVLIVRRKPIDTERFRLIGLSSSGEQLQIDLWYSKANQWLALDSITNGRHLRYQLQ